jgi:glycosyltransferase involved in cell wall biosynthesis
MLISAIIPTLNMAHFLPDAIASIARQDISVDEIIVIDCGSTDETDATIKRLRNGGAPPILFIETSEQNPAAARNKALEKAQGNFIAFLDADDLWPANKLSAQLGFLNASSDKGMVSGYVTYFDILDRETLAPASHARTDTIFHVHLGACVYRHAVFERVGAFNPTLTFGEDLDLLMRVREANIGFSFLPRETLYYRKHAASMMAKNDTRKKTDFCRVIAMSVARRRAGGLAPLNLTPFESFIEQVPSR